PGFRGFFRSSPLGRPLRGRSYPPICQHGPVSTASELRWLDATAQAELVRTGDVQPVELVDAAIARIEADNDRLNAVIHPLFDKARDVARSADLGGGPLRGVPFLVKDGVCHTEGDPFHCGMRALKEIGWREASDTWLARRFRDAGFVFCGKTNLPELATSITTEPLAYGPTHNPWDLDFTAGGSSGGSAAAVAAGMVPVAHGNDMGGSIRFPASMCGIVGLKPTRARTTLGPDFGEYWGPLTHEFVLTRSVRDTALVLDAVAGPGTGDPYTAPPPLRPWITDVGADAGRLRIGFRTRLRAGDGNAHPACVAAVEHTAALLESLGHDVEADDVAALDAAGSEQFGVLLCAAVARDLDRWSARTGRVISDDDVEPQNAFLAKVGRSISAVDYVAGVEGLQRWTRGVAAWWEDHDVLVLPTSPEPPFRLGSLDANNDPAAAARMGEMVMFTMPFDITGQPAISLPLHWSDAAAGSPSLPVGVQLVAAYGREDLLLRVAAQLEAAAPWADRHPPGF
ncbi:MAG: amidase, partial [Actinomycetota bacterium]|nr:amidase [Actinomycetota bacterium]